MPEPLRSPKQSRASARARSNPYQRPANRHTTRDASVGADGPASLFGTLKSIVTAPLSWLASSGHKGSNNALNNSELAVKRKVSFDERSGTPPKSKRIRRKSPELEDEEEPLPSVSSVIGLKRPPLPLWDLGNGVPRARMQPIDQPQPPANAIEFPLPPSRGASRFTMSVEPLDKLAARRSVTRERSLPPPSPFARGFSSVSLTPQPAGATFGPSPKRKLREFSVPPVISVPSTPRFVRPSSSVPPTSVFRRPVSREPSEGPIMSLMSQTRQVRILFVLHSPFPLFSNRY
jgi:nucleoporin NUP1